MEYLDGILKLAERELSAIEQNGKFRSRDEVESVYKLIDIVKDIYCIWDYESGSSYTGHSYRNYDDGMGSYARRDSMGRYSREGSGRRSYRGYSRDDGKMEYIGELRELMNSAPDEQTRQSIHRMIQQMENA